MEQAFDYLDAPVLRVTGKDVPMPYAANLEKLALPSVDEVVEAAKAVTTSSGSRDADQHSDAGAVAHHGEGQPRQMAQEGRRQVKSGDVIAEIETDKATMEVEAVDEGVLAKIVVPEGTQDVTVNALIAVLAGEGEDVKAAAAAPRRPAPRRSQPEAPQAAARSANLPQGGGAARAAAPQSPRHAVASGAACRAGGVSLPTSGNRIFASPLARRIAKEAGIDLSRVQGLRPAWPRHRARFRRRRKPAKACARPAPPPAATAAAPAIAAVAVGRADPRVLRARLATISSRTTDPQHHRAAAHRVDADDPAFLSDARLRHRQLLAARAEINAAAPKDKDGKPAYKLSVNDFVIKALALALKRVPDANVSWTEGGMLKHKHADIGVAVAIPGGLITPIVRHAESKSLSAISSEMKDLAARAKARKLMPEEYPGRHLVGVEPRHVRHQEFLRRHQPAAGDHSRGRRRRGAGGREERALAVATIMSVTLSCDHRAVDGALGAELSARSRR